MKLTTILKTLEKNKINYTRCEDGNGRIEFTYNGMNHRIYLNYNKDKADMFYSEYYYDNTKQQSKGKLHRTFGAMIDYILTIKQKTRGLKSPIKG